MKLANEDRGNLVGGFIVVDGDEVLGDHARPARSCAARSTTTSGPTGRSTKGVKFVAPKEGDAVAVVARSRRGARLEAATDGGEAGQRAGRPTPTSRPPRDAGRNRRMRPRVQQSMRR